MGCEVAIALSGEEDTRGSHNKVDTNTPELKIGSEL